MGSFTALEVQQVGARGRCAPVGLGGSARVHSTPIDRVASIDGQIDELMQDIDILALNADDQTTDEFDQSTGCCLLLQDL